MASSVDDVKINYVSVYIIEGTTSDRSEVVRKMFNHPIFCVYVIKAELPDDWIKERPHLSLEDAEELYTFSWCLVDAKHRTPDNNVVIIRDTSVSNLNPSQLAEMISIATQKADVDLTYLNRWQDRCDLYTDKMTIPNSSSQLVRTYSPHGCQAILLSPRGRDLILGNVEMRNGQMFKVTTSLSSSLNYNISQGYITANCFVPNLVSFSLDAARHNDDYYKSQECRQPETGGLTSDGSNVGEVNGSWIWLVLIFILIVGLILLWIWAGRSSISTHKRY